MLGGMPEVPQGQPIPPDQAWRIFEKWRASGREIGALFVATSGYCFTLGTLQSARNGTVHFQGESCAATIRLQDAQFTYGPMMTWPRWPNPPIVEIIALQATTPNGTWIVMSDGLRPQSLASMMLPG
jgi:hypothetical protein